jgi:histidine ammonia-lyase
MVLDAGNSIIKAKIARKEQGEITFPHAMRKLTESEYNNIVSRTGTTANMQDFLRINGQPYVVGESAERLGIVSQRTGAARYTKDYYGVLAAAALGRLYERGREVAV